MRKIYKNQRGFTLTEILIVLAIVVVLLAVAIPSIVAVQSNLTMTDLDAAAKEIYTASQNRLTALKASGELSELNTRLYEDYDGQNLQNAFSMSPSDYPSGDGWMSMYYIKNSDAVTNDYIMSGVAFQSLDGYYIIEINPESGDTYSVFYCEYENEADFVAAYADSVYYNRSEDLLKDYKIGYYCGSDSSVSSIPDSFTPSVIPYNEEELYLKLTCPDMLRLSTTRQYLTVKLTLTDQHGGTKELSYTGYDIDIDGDDMVIYVLLDSMRAGYSFADITGLAPGDDVTAVVTMEYSFRGKVITTDPACVSNTATFSSLFAGKSEASGVTTITVNKLRHLNNLRGSTYNHEGSGSVAVNQTEAIDFNAGNWDDSAWCPLTASKTNPLGSFAPIVNDTLFGSSATAGLAAYSGNKILNMSISGGDNAGLFAYSNCDISNVSLIDPIVSGGSNTGALVGAAYGGSIRNCGVYLSTSDKNGNDYTPKEMSDRADTYTVTASSGSANAGGLAGRLRGVSVTDSFAAINVSADGASYAGGLAGLSTSSTISGCYASGNVSAAGYVGGLLGSMTSGSVTNCYSTSDIVANSYAGGFVGLASSGSVSGCKSYGTVKTTAGGTNLTTSGAFAGRTSGASFSNCVYLRQNGYNNGYDSISMTGISNSTYSALRVSPANAVSNSHPYAGALFNTAFPFAMLGSEHYGDWPQEFTIDTSMIYYEKYQNAAGTVSYGYYADGYATDINNTDGSSWNLNTLMTQSQLNSGGYFVVEDGYAILSVYNLARMTYSLNSSATKTINVSSTAGANSFTLIANPASLDFTTSNGTFTVKYLYIFQLPFELQETNRDASFAFFDQVDISGYAKGNLTKTVFANYTFYYCPHFAKNAINPDINETNPGRPQYPDELTVYVRSARQLNALGRYCYYWNHFNNISSSSYSIIFSQEIDINFAKYTKTYCGRTFNLMDTTSSNTYRNRPIGRPVNQTFTDPWGNTYSPGSFQNSYNGNCHKIIDYCVYCYSSDAYQFVGLFGEINKANISNVFMVASDPDSGSGYVTSEYNATTGKNPGTGALVGLSYVDTSTLSNITNCSVSGYTVKYYLSGSMPTSAAAVGGLIGYNMGNVTNCSAVSKQVIADIGTVGSGKELYVGGLIGSHMNGTVSNSYAGGALVLDVNTLSSTACAVNGLTGYCYVWYPSGQSMYATINRCYSYCDIDCANGTKYSVCGGVASNVNSASSCYYLKSGISSTVTLASDRSGVTGYSLALMKALSLTGFGTAAASYPWSSELSGLSFPFPAAVKNASGNYVHYGDWPVVLPEAAYLTYYEAYSDGSYGYYFYDEASTLTNTLSDDKDIFGTGYGLLKLSGGTQTVKLTDASGNALSAAIETTSPANLAIGSNNYELYPFTAAGLTAVAPASGSTERKLVLLSGTEALADGLSAYVNVKFGAAIKASSGLGSSGSPLQVRTPDQLRAVSTFSYTGTTYFAQTRDISLFGYAVSTATYAGTLRSGWTFNGNSKVISYTSKPVFDSVSGTVTETMLSFSAAPLANSSAGTLSYCSVSSYAGTANYSTAALVVTNTGTISGCSVTDSSLTLSGTAAGAVLMATNTGTVTGCTVTDSSLTLSGSATGALLANASAGNISGCSVIDCTVSGDGNASGFILNNNSGGSISGCASIRTNVASGSGVASGFVNTNAGSITQSYVAPAAKAAAHTGYDYGTVTITGREAYGFAGSSTGSTLSYCYAVAAVHAANGNAAGFAGSSAYASYSYANSDVTSDAALASGFAITGSSGNNRLIYCYACGSVNGYTREYGFMSSGYANYCYSVCVLKKGSRTLSYGFAPTAATTANCYWVSDSDAATGMSHNAALSGETISDGTEVTFYALYRQNWLAGSTTAYPFSEARGTEYPYSITGVTHHGDWPANPVAPAIVYAGRLGVAEIDKSYRTYSRDYYGYYNVVGGSIYSDSTNGPSITWNSSYYTTRYYLFWSGDLSPAMSAAGGWSYTPNGVSIDTSTTAGGYTYCRISSIDDGDSIDFKLDNVTVFTVEFSVDWWGTTVDIN